MYNAFDMHFAMNSRQDFWINITRRINDKSDKSDIFAEN